MLYDSRLTLVRPEALQHWVHRTIWGTGSGIGTTLPHVAVDCGMCCIKRMGGWHCERWHAYVVLKLWHTYSFGANKHVVLQRVRKLRAVEHSFVPLRPSNEVVESVIQRAMVSRYIHSCVEQLSTKLQVVG